MLRSIFCALNKSPKLVELVKRRHARQISSSMIIVAAALTHNGMSG